MLVHFSRTQKGAEAVAESMEIKGLRLDPNERDSALLCIRDSIVGSRNIVADAQFADVPRVAPMRIRLPVEDSAIYSFLNTGDMKHYGNDYDGRP